MKIRFGGSVYDPSGYAEYSRYFIYALDKAGVDIGVVPIMTDPHQHLDFGKKGKLIKRLASKRSRPDINVVNMIPLFFKPNKVVGAKNVGFTMWETDTLPDIWVKQCNDMDAIFVPSQWNKDVFEGSGVTVPIHIVHAGIDEEEIKDFSPRTSSEKFKFYSIFQWISRKNPDVLLRSYFAEFEGHRDVELILKTYKKTKGAGGVDIHQEIAQIKEDMGLKDYPDVRVISDLLSDAQIRELHEEADCFVLPHAAEGWGIPCLEAMAYGKPVISTGYSANLEFMTNENSYLLDYQLTHVTGMRSFMPSFKQWFDGKMKWAQPDAAQLQEYMRHVYKNPENAIETGAKARRDVLEKFNTVTAADSFMDACKEVLEQK